MAEAALLGVAKSVIEQLGEPALQELLLMCNSKKELQRLEETIRTITDFLHDAEQRESTEDLVRGWLSRLKEVLYEADDLFDSVTFRALHKKAMSGSTLKNKVHRFSSKLKQPGFDLKVAHGVKDIRERLDGIKDDMSQFSFALIKPRAEAEESSASVRLRNREETHSFVKAEDVIGRGDEREDIVSLLLGGGEEEEKSLAVVSVIGFGGMGKTTLAQLVYNDERVVSGFDVRLWVCINYLSDLKQVLVSILASAHKSKPDGHTLDQVQQMFREEIASKRFLLVLDDVWDDNASNWLKLKSLLSCGKNGNKVLVTTRSARVAQCLDARKPYYHLNVLSEETACSLFVRMAFEDGELSRSDSDELEPLVKKIVRKCGYVPLVLVTVGRMLRYKEKEKRSWMSFVEKELPEVFSDAVGDGNGNIMRVLKFSYDDLPPPLKHCFAYCSLFPKDYVFWKDELVRLWIAQGFIVPHGKKSLEEVGDDYFFQMVHRCFFQEVKMYTEWYGCAGYSCKMHDLLHDLAIQVAGKECNYVGAGMEGVGDKIAHSRHIYLNCDLNLLLDHSSMSSQSKSLRTLVLCNRMELEAKCLDSFCASFKVLRALQLSPRGLRKLPEAIGELIHLRYVNLSGNYEITYLPNSICKLHHLHSLKLEDCGGLKELPSNLGRLVSLRHLLLENCHALDAMPSGLAALTGLVTLDRLKVHPRNGGLRYMGHLDDLCGMLSIELPKKGWINCIEDARESGMFRKHKLNGMSIEWEVDWEVTRGLKEEEASIAKAVLELLKSNENLQYLKIIGYEGDTLSNWFSSLSNLKVLVLSECGLEYLEDVGCIRSGGSSLFPCLEILRMEKLRNLKGWWRDLGDKAPMSQLPSLPRVSEVDIVNCPHLVENMPLFGGEIKVLRLIKVNTKLLNMSLSSTRISKLQVLDLFGLTGLECLPEGSISCLTALKSLKIADCKELRWVSSRGLAYLTSLEKLMISNRGDVRLLDDKRGCDGSEITTTATMMPWASLQRLCKLEVPWQSHLLEGLQYLTSLEELTVWYDEDDNVDAHDEILQGKLGLLERLHTLKVEFKGLQCNFPRWVQHLRCIKLLVLDARFGPKELMNMSWGSLAKMNLRSLHMFWISKVSRCSVDDWVAEQQQQLTSLVELFICGRRDDQEGGCTGDIPWKLLPCLRTLELNCDYRWNLSSVPNGVQHLASLQVLKIGWKVHYGEEEYIVLGIQAIPDWMINLTSLQRLSIRPCSSELAKRCKKQTGEDWHLISHIPDTDIYIF